MQITNRVAMMSSTALLLVQALAITAQSQPAPEVAIDRMFRYESSSTSRQGRDLLISFKKWMETYQRIRTDGNNYEAIFDGGSLPIEAKFKANGSIESLNFGCPISKSLSINDAPEDLRKALSKCAGFKS
ncbi:MAG: hypothetical protein LH613_14755 [Chamaesiphon sp.]|nr:hypothetical protein [Chamaesiphon sp.]